MLRIESSQETAQRLGLRVAPINHGMAHAVFRGDDQLFYGSKREVSVFLRGYEANATTMPPKRLSVAIEHLDAMIDDEDAGNDRILDAAIEVASVYRDDITGAPPAARCVRCGATKGELIDNGWLYGALCTDCAQLAVDDIGEALTAAEYRS